MEFLQDYIVVIVMGICFCVGFILKNAFDVDKINRFIPLIMGVLGVLLNVWLNNFAFTPEILLGGLVSGLASTGMWEGIKNVVSAVKKEK